MKGFGNKLTLLKAAFLLAALGLFLASCIERSPRIPVTITGSNTLPPVTARVSTSNFGKFSHNEKIMRKIGELIKAQGFQVHISDKLEGIEAGGEAL